MPPSRQYLKSFFVGENLNTHAYFCFCMRAMCAFFHLFCFLCVTHTRSHTGCVDRGFLYFLYFQYARGASVHVRGARTRNNFLNFFTLHVLFNFDMSLGLETKIVPSCADFQIFIVLGFHAFVTSKSCFLIGSVQWLIPKRIKYHRVIWLWN